MLLEVGQKGPNFTLPDENGQAHQLSDYQGKYVLLYFYPRDNTPGCTTEACNFRDDYSHYKNANVTILGVSPDSPETHTKFINKFDLPFTLLADEDHRVCELYGTWGPKKSFGKVYDGIHRTTYLIDPEGSIKEVYKKVSPAKHSAEVLAAIENS